MTWQNFILISDEWTEIGPEFDDKEKAYDFYYFVIANFPNNVAIMETAEEV